ncbi:MAG: hypothetical protein V1799_01260 [bacterium]
MIFSPLRVLQAGTTEAEWTLGWQSSLGSVAATRAGTQCASTALLLTLIAAG